jgi:hypothetical protein
MISLLGRRVTAVSDMRPSFAVSSHAVFLHPKEVRWKWKKVAMTGRSVLNLLREAVNLME